MDSSSGEHEVPNEDAGGRRTSGGRGGDSEIDPETAAVMEQQLREAQEQLLSVPAGQIVANHVIGLFELAALHLRVNPPNLEEARLPIDAMGILVEQLVISYQNIKRWLPGCTKSGLRFVEVQNQTPDDEA